MSQGARFLNGEVLDFNMLHAGPKDTFLDKHCAGDGRRVRGVKVCAFCSGVANSFSSRFFSQFFPTRHPKIQIFVYPTYIFVVFEGAIQKFAQNFGF